MYSKTEPVLVLGPDWPYALVKLLAVNLVVGYSINTFVRDSWFYWTFDWVLFIWNLIFLLLVIWNPGMAPKDPNIHNMVYLKKIQKNNFHYRICKLCKILHRENAKGSYNIHHCKICDTCVEGHEFHF